MNKATRATFVTGLVLAAAVLQATPALAHGDDDIGLARLTAQLAKVRQATLAFDDVHAAIGAGYAPLADKDGIYCIADPAKGTMGIHYVNGGLVSDGVVDPQKPEAVIYEPMGNGKLRLVAVEYIVFQSAWHADPSHGHRPKLFGHSFDATPAGNRFGIPAFYSLHLWLWQFNPAGLFDDWNPLVQCR